jgi:hypothetical protein
MPEIEGADLTSISTKTEAYPEQEYLMLITGSEFMDEAKKTLIIKRKIVEPAEFVDRESWDFINLVQNDGKKNDIGLKTLKRYLEAVFGKDSPESQRANSDPLTGHMVKVYLTQKQYKGRDWVEGDELEKGNKTKKISAA